MGWFHEWWLSIGLLGQVFACAAIPMTIIMLLQAVLMVAGGAFGGDSDDAGADGPDFDADSDADFGMDGDVEFDIDGDVEFDTEGNASTSGAGTLTNNDTVRILTVRGVVAFFAIGGWAGLAALTAGLRSIWAINIALLAGVAAMLVASAVIRFALRMQSSGNIDLRNAVLQTAEVYITIPPLRANTGRVTMVLQERFVEIEAVTDSETPIKSKTIVEIVGLRDKDCLVVRPLKETDTKPGGEENTVDMEIEEKEEKEEYGDNKESKED